MSFFTREQLRELIKERNMKTTGDISKMLKDLFSRVNWAEIATFFQYPLEIRKIICTTNMIESCHRQLRKVTKGKSIFPNDESLQKMLYLAAMDVIRKWTGRVQNWGQILLQLSVFFPNKV